MKLATVELGVVTNVMTVEDPDNIPPVYRDAPEVPDDMPVGVGWSYDGAVFSPPVPPPTTAQQIKEEAERRILEICPVWRQRNLTAQAVILAEKGRGNWTAEEADAWKAGEAVWAQIEALRMKSDEIEMMDPIPSDYRADKYWK